MDGSQIKQKPPSDAALAQLETEPKPFARSFLAAWPATNANPRQEHVCQHAIILTGKSSVHDFELDFLKNPCKRLLKQKMPRRL